MQPRAILHNPRKYDPAKRNAQQKQEHLDGQ